MILYITQSGAKTYAFGVYDYVCLTFIFIQKGVFLHQFAYDQE